MSDWKEWIPDTVEECAAHTKALIEIAVQHGPKILHDGRTWDPVGSGIDSYQWCDVEDSCSEVLVARVYQGAARALGIL